MTVTSAHIRIFTMVAGLFLGSNATSLADATTVTSNIAVSALSLSSCTLVAGPLAFGNYTQTVNNATAALTVLCTATTPYTIGLNSGTTTGGTQAARLLYNLTAGTTLAYTLFTDSGRTVPWAANTVSGTGSGLTQTVNVYGQIAAGLQAAPGAYADVVTATLTY